MFYVPFLLNSTIDWSCWFIYFDPSPLDGKKNSSNGLRTNPFIHSPPTKHRQARGVAWRGSAGRCQLTDRNICAYDEADEDSHCQIVLRSTVDFCNFWYMPFYHHVKAMPSSTASLDLVVFLPVILLWFFYIVNEETKKYTTIKNFYALQPNEFPTFAFHHIA